MSKQSVEDKIFEFRAKVIKKGVMRRVRNSSVRLGRFFLLEEWKRKQQECLEKLRRISRALYPEKYRS